jgi:hypothetical protein
LDRLIIRSRRNDHFVNEHVELDRNANPIGREASWRDRSGQVCDPFELWKQDSELAFVLELDALANMGASTLPHGVSPTA